MTATEREAQYLDAERVQLDHQIAAESEGARAAAAGVKVCPYRHRELRAAWKRGHAGHVAAPVVANGASKPSLSANA